MVELGSKEFWDRLVEDPKKLASEVNSIDLVDLQTTLQRQSSLHAWVNAAYEAASIDEARVEREVDKARARALLKAKEEKDKDTGKAKTVEVLKAEVELDAEVDKLTEKLFIAQDKSGGLKAMSYALNDRLQMLIQIAAKHRAEYNDRN